MDIPRLVLALKPPLSNNSNYSLGRALRQILYDNVRPYYEQPHRVYHDMRHIDKMLTTHDLMYGHSPSDALFCAILFHDAIWMPMSSPTVEHLSTQLVPSIAMYLSGKHFGRRLAT